MNQNGNIHKEAAVSDVVKVILDVLVDKERPVGADLPKARNARNRLKSLTLFGCVVLHDEGHLWPWPHERHASKKDVD